MNGSSKIKNRTTRARNRNNELTLVASCTHGEGCRAQWALHGPKRKQSGEEEQAFQRVSCGCRKVLIPMYKAIAIVAVIVIFRWQHQPATTMVATLRTTATKWYMRHIGWGYIVNECHCTHLLAGGFASGGFAGGLLGSGHGVMWLKS